MINYDNLSPNNLPNKKNNIWNYKPYTSSECANNYRMLWIQYKFV